MMSFRFSVLGCSFLVSPSLDFGHFEIFSYSVRDYSVYYAS